MGDWAIEYVGDQPVFSNGENTMDVGIAACILNKAQQRIAELEAQCKAETEKEIAQWQRCQMFERELKELRAQLAEAREALDIIRTANPMNTYVCEIADKALAGEE